MIKYDKLKSKFADLYFQLNEEEESELSSDRESMPMAKKSDKTKSIDLEQLSQRSLSVQDKAEKKTDLNLPTKVNKLLS